MLLTNIVTNIAGNRHASSPYQTIHERLIVNKQQIIATAIIQTNSTITAPLVFYFTQTKQFHDVVKQRGNMLMEPQHQFKHKCLYLRVCRR